jgi:protein O-GlcNAc transferase
MKAAVQPAVTREKLRLAGQLLQGSRKSEAQVVYRDVLLFDPMNTTALHALAYIALESANLGAARHYMERAVAAEPRDASLKLALGRVQKESGEYDAAIESYEEALKLDHCLVDAWLCLGVALRGKDAQRALACYQEAMRLDPRNKIAPINVANILFDLGREAEAEPMLRKAIARAPNAATAHLNLGKLLKNSGRSEEAADCLRRALLISPYLADAALHLGELEMAAGRCQEAVELFRLASTGAPKNATAHLLLADALRETEQYDQSIVAYRRCLEVDPREKGAHNNLGCVLQLGGLVGPSIESAQRALEIDPDFVDARCTLAGGLAQSGDTAAADESYRTAVQQSALYAAFAGYLMNVSYLGTADVAAVFARHREFDERYGSRVERHTGHGNDADAGRRLRVGYVSADLRRHSVAYFIEPVLEAHDRERFEVYGYFNHASGDEVSERLRAQVDGWVPCVRLSDEELAQRIRADRIDILVDLAGHTAGNRLLTFARKPAPVQVTYLGYPTSTGLSAIDYRLTDWEVDPHGYEAFNAERPIRLEHSYYCYRPFERSPPVSVLPARQAGHITFGSFNNFAKASPETLELWARVLEAVPGSRLLLKAKSLGDAGVRAGVLERLTRLGVEAERVELRGWEGEVGGQLVLYGQMDIGLDTYPYNGGTTTCEALWMGVPVVTLAGATHASRMGASLLKAAGLGQLVARSAEHYVRIAQELAQDRDGLEAMRSGMRERLRGSALLDEHGFTRGLEAAYRQMWRNWCEQTVRA